MDASADDTLEPSEQPIETEVSVTDLQRFATGHADLDDDEVMARAWGRDDGVSMRGAHAIDTIPEDAGPLADS